VDLKSNIKNIGNYILAYASCKTEQNGSNLLKLLIDDNLKGKSGEFFNIFLIIF